MMSKLDEKLKIDISVTSLTELETEGVVNEGVVLELILEHVRLILVGK